MNLDINWFDPTTMRPGAVVLIIGRRGSGKSVLAADIMSYARNCKRGVCVSATERANPFWSKHIPSCFIHHEYNDKIVKSLFSMQKKCKERLGKVEPAFAIFDDVMFDRSFMKSQMTRRIFMNGRHDGIFTLVTAQWLMDVPPDLRANVDYTIVLRDNIRANRERVYKYFAGMFDTFAAFDEVMKQCTEDREAMVIDQGSLSHNISDAVFFYKATPDLKYKIGASEYWEYSRLKDAEEQELLDDDDFENRRREVKITKRYPRRKHENEY